MATTTETMDIRTIIYRKTMELMMLALMVLALMVLALMVLALMVLALMVLALMALALTLALAQTDEKDQQQGARSTSSQTSKCNGIIHYYNFDIRTKKKFSPYKINSANTQLGLTILLDPDIENYWVSENNFVGFRVLVHHPYEYPEVRGKGFAIGKGKEAFLAVSGQVTDR